MIELHLTTPRLTLRPLRGADAPELQHLVSDWDVARMTARIPHPYPPNGAAQWIAFKAKERALGGGTVFGVEYLGQFAGCVSLRAAETDHPGEAMELGAWIGLPYWGHGLATEAAGAVVAFAFGALGLRKVVAGHFADNPAAGRVLAKLGFVRTGRGRLYSVARCGEAETVFMALPRDAWVA